MIKSMTGYGKADGFLSGKKITVEIKSVNHRFLEISLRLPQMLLPIESEIKKSITEQFCRGKIDVVVRDNGEINGADEERFALNMPLVRNYYALLCQLKEELDIAEGVSLSTLAGLRDVFVPVETKQQAADLWEGFRAILAEAAGNFSAMRKKEGESLARDLRERMKKISGFLDKIEARAPVVVTEYQKKFAERVRELTGGVWVDDARLLQEVAIMAEKSDITEEIVRIHSHTQQFLEMLEGDDAAGRKIDFLLQEMGREINTIGSKSADVEISRCVIEIKSELSKLREQVQNIE